MLRKPNEMEFERYLDFAYELALDPSRSGYPTYSDGVKTKADFIRHAKRAFTDESEGVLLFERNGRVCGWIQYFGEPEEKYMQTHAFCIESGTKQAIEEFIAYAREKFPGYELYLGFSADNTEAVMALEALGCELIEQSYNNLIKYDGYISLPDNEHIVEVTEKNYPLFSALHTQDDMYWTADRILEALPNWRIFAYLSEGKALGAVYFRMFDDSSEIFGIDLIGGTFNGEIFRALLTSALSFEKARGANHTWFFSEEHEQPDTLACGFRCVGKYLCFKTEL